MTVISGASSIRCDILAKAALKPTFRVFTAEMGRWWPPDYHIGASAMRDVVIELRAGGRWFERGIDGTECDWGHVVRLEPDALVVLSWQLTSRWQFDPDRSKGSEVIVRFVSESATVTRVGLEHREFERHGADAAAVRSGLAREQGWAEVLRRFADCVAHPA
jgi:uncharacterized protein YndB with AHSA1/START domain